MTLKNSTIIATDTDLGLCVRLNSHHFNLNTVSDQRFVPVCSQKRPEARVRATPCWSATSPRIVDHFLAVPCLSPSISPRGSVLTRTWWGPPCFCLAAMRGSSGYMQQQDLRHYVERAEAEGLLMLSYYWLKVR